VTVFPGIHCVLFALFDANERLDRAAMKAQAAYVKSIGVDGVTILGLATEVGKLTFAERCQLIDWAAEDANALPLSVTIIGNSVAEQVALIRHAEAAGAAWLILQPPLVGTYPASEYIDFFARAGNETRLPFAIQNAPQYLGRSLSDQDIADLRDRCANLALIKSETSAIDLAGLVKRVGSTLTILNGRGGLEMTDCLRAGCDGFIVAPDVLPGVVACYRAWKSGQIDLAHMEYAKLLPAASFAMQSLEHLICYGKRIFGMRSGITIYDRSPALRPTEFGLATASAWAGIEA
jgi:2-keto-3-deoxy-L-arabinonate dehydratase